MPKPVAFEKLPVGACFAYDVDAPKATRRKVDERHTVVLPGSKSFRVDSVETRVYTKACPVNFGRRRKRRRNKRSR